MRVRLYLDEILACIENIRNYTHAGQAAFLAERMIQDAVIRNIEVIGEASRNIPDEMRAAEPDVPWRNIAAMRNLLIHRYFRVDLQQVWRVVESDLSPLEEATRRLLTTLSQDQ